MQTFKLRAECTSDLTQLADILAGVGHHVSGWEVTADPQFPDATVVFNSSATVEELRDACTQVPDGHVMEETVAPFALYTGERVHRQSMA